jgi:membrane-associated protease RseP (regulator of RpoE activity)
VIVMAGGPTVNIAIAFGLFAILFATYGNPRDEVVEPTVAAVPECVIPVEEQGRDCTAADPATPAKEAGIQPGDEILSFNGTPFRDWESFQQLIRGNADGDAVIEVRRGDEQLTLTTNTTVTLRQTSIEDETLTEVGFLGVQPETRFETGGLIYTTAQMGTMTVETVQALGQLPVKVYEVGRAVVGLQERDPESPVSIVGGGRFAGEAAASEAFPLTEKIVTLLFLVASFNFFIGMFNFVPLLPLDGGHIAGALYEGLKRGVARLLGRPDPGHVDVARLLPVAYVVGLAMLVMGVVLIVADIVVPLRLS